MTVSDKPRLFFATAVVLCAGLLFLSLAAVWFGANIAAAQVTEESILVRDVNVRNDPDRQDDPEDEFQLEFTNGATYEADNPPQVTTEGFVFVEEASEDESGDLWEPVEEGAEVDHLAHTWVSGPGSLSNLDEGAVNELDFVVDVPLGTENGSYTAAVVVRDQDGELLNHQLIVINVGFSDEEEDSRYDLELSEKSFDLEAAETRAVITNKSLWHIAGSVELRLKDNNDDTEFTVSLLPESDFPLTLFPGFEKAWILEERDIVKIQAFIEDKEDFDAELVFLVSQEAEEAEEIVAASWNVKADIIPETEDGDADADNDKEENVQAGQQQAGENEPGTTSSDGNFLTDNLMLLIGGGGALLVILLLVLLVARRRRSPAKIVSSTPHSASIPQPEKKRPLDPTAAPAARTDITSSDSGGGMPPAEKPASGDGSSVLENLPSLETVQDLSLPVPDVPGPVSGAATDTSVPPVSSSPPAQASVEEEKPSIRPALGGIPQLPPLEDVTSPSRPEIPVDVPPPAETTPVADIGGNPPQASSDEKDQQPPAAAI